MHAAGRGKIMAIKRKPGHLVRAEKFLEMLCSWVETREDVRALVVVGSFARREARPDSDLDIVLLARDPDVYLADTTWVQALGESAVLGLENYGKVTSVRALIGDGLDVELGIASADWASEPYDPGTEDVARGGIEVLLDRDGHATALATAMGVRVHIGAWTGKGG